MSEINKSRAEYIMNHYSNTKKDILVLAKHLDEHDKDLQHQLALAQLDNVRLREALNFYADHERSMYDDGKVATEALNKINEMKGE